MYLGKRVLVRHNGDIKEGNVTEIFTDSVQVRLENNEVISRYFWELGVIKDA